MLLPVSLCILQWYPLLKLSILYHNGTVRFISGAHTKHQELDTDYNRTHILEEFTDQAVCL